jgi:hypothetical protein
MSMPLGRLVVAGKMRGEIPMSTACDNRCLERQQMSLYGLRVLVVDDNADSLDLLAFILEEYGGKVIKALGAVEALEIIQHVNVHLLISDLVMPQVDGYDLIRRIRRLSPQQGGLIPAIALTAQVTEEARTLALSSGFQSYLTKPFEPKSLVALVAKLTLANSIATPMS